MAEEICCFFENEETKERTCRFCQCLMVGEERHGLFACLPKFLKRIEDLEERVAVIERRDRYEAGDDR